MAGIMERLRSETRKQHIRLEHAVDLESRLETRGAYRDLLIRMLGLQQPLEEALQRIDWSTTPINMDERRKTAWLSQDLLALGCTEQQIAAIPECVELPELNNVAHGIGCLYVLEGSTLGGSVIARRLERILRIGSDQGGRFYASYGERLHLMWSRLGAAAEQCCDSAAAADQACTAARDTFRCFEAWLRRDRRNLGDAPRSMALTNTGTGG